MNCGECEGTKQVGSGKSKMVCPICKGEGTNPEVMDSSGKELIRPGELARILPRQIGTKDNGEIIYSDGYKGKVLHITPGRKGTNVVTIMAQAELSSAGQKTFNHGYRSARPEHIRMLKSNANQRRLKQYKESKEAKKT